MTVFFPERLFKIFMVNSGPTFNMVWALVSPFLDPNTKNKVKNVSNEELLEFVDKD